MKTFFKEKANCLLSLILIGELVVAVTLQRENKTYKTMKQVRLYNGIMMPSIGYGVFQIPREETEKAVSEALETGYRMVDTDRKSTRLNSSHP